MHYQNRICRTLRSGSLVTWRSQGVLQTGVAVVEGDTTVESLIELNFGASEAEAAGLLGDLKALAFPLHDVVVADDTLMNEATYAVEILRSGAPSEIGWARRPGKATVIVDDELAQDQVGGVQIHGTGKAEFAGEAILQYAPKTLDPALGLGGLSGDEGDAELFKGASELRTLTFAGQLFREGPELVVADKDAAAIAVEGQRHTVTTQELPQQREIAKGGLRGKELCGQDFPRGIVLHAQSSEAWTATLQPIMGRAIELHQFSEASGSETPLTMRRGTALSGRAQTGLPQEAPQGLAAERETLDLAEFFAEMVIVKPGIGSTSQPQDRAACLGRQAAGAGSSAVGVRQSRLPSSRKRFLRRLTCRMLSESSAAALAHAMSPLRQLAITLTRCSSF